MAKPRLRYSQLPGRFAVCQLTAAEPVPSWCVHTRAFSSITRTRDELSIVCAVEGIPADVKCEGGWMCFKLDGPFPFSQTGVLASFVQPLAESAIPIFAVSTFDTDYVLIKEEFQESAVSALRLAGHTLITAE